MNACELCGATTDLRWIENYAGVAGADGWVCKSVLGCVERQVEYSDEAIENEQALFAALEPDGEQTP